MRQEGQGPNRRGEWLCGIHLGAYNRVKKNRAAEKAQWEQDTAINDRTRQILAALTEQYGLAGNLYHSPYGGNCGGQITVDARKLQGILNMLSTPFDPAAIHPPPTNGGNQNGTGTTETQGNRD